MFRDHDGDIVVSIHNQRQTKKDIRAFKRSKKEEHTHHNQIGSDLYEKLLHLKSGRRNVVITC